MYQPADVYQPGEVYQPADMYQPVDMYQSADVYQPADMYQLHVGAAPAVIHEGRIWAISIFFVGYFSLQMGWDS